MFLTRRRIGVLALVSVLILLVSGCGIKYTYRSNIPFSSRSLTESPQKQIGIAIRGAAIDGLYACITSDIERYAARPLTFLDVSADLFAATDQFRQEALKGLRAKYPEMRYVLIFVEAQPRITKSYFYTPPEVYIDFRGQKTETPAQHRYSTTYAVPSDIILADMIDQVLIAQAAYTFSETQTTETGGWGFHGGPLAWALTQYPVIDRLTSNTVQGYIYLFLKNLGPERYFGEESWKFPGFGG